MKLVKDIDLSPFMADDSHEKVRPASAYQEVVDALYADRARSTGVHPPMQALRGKFQFRPGEMTALGGQNGCGKTWLESQIMQTCMRQGQGVLLCGFELAPAMSIRRLLRQAARTDEPSAEYRRAWHQWSDGRLWILDHQGAFAGDKMLALLRWAHANLPVQHVVIDSFMKLSIGPEDYAAQKALINRMHLFAMETGKHLHLVVHARKSERETDRLDKFSIKGTSEIVDQVDNLLLLTRNLEKERKIEFWQRERRDFDNPSVDMLDTLSAWDAGLRVAKQRHGEWDGGTSLWLDRRAMAFSDRSDAIVPAIPMQELVPLDLEPDAERAAIQAEGAPA